MEFKELISQRHSVRVFSEKPIENEKLNYVLEAGRLAPTAKNSQPQKIYLVKSEQALEKIRAITPCAFNAPVVMIICGDSNKSCILDFESGKHDFTEMDISIVTTHMMLAATDIGLATTWVGYFDAQKIKDAFNLGENIYPYCLLPIGYASEKAIVDSRHNMRNPLSETVFEL